MINQKIKLTMVSLAALAIAGCGDQGDAGGGSAEAVDNSVEAIHERVITLDTHVDIHEDMSFDPVYDPGTDTQQQVDLGKMESGGLDSAFFIVYVGQNERTEAGYAMAKEKARRKFRAIHRMVDHYPDRIGFANTPDEFDAIAASGRKVATIGIENGYVIGKDLSLVEDYYNQGARYMTLAHNGHNDICDSANPLARLGDGDEEHGGVSEFGYQVIDEMNRVGMMVDISHVSIQCMMQATEYSKAPVIASHSGVWELAKNQRNLNDDQLKAVGAANGVVQIVGLDGFVKHYPEKSAEVAALRAAAAAAAGDAGWDRSKHAGSAEYMAGMEAIDVKYPPANVKDFVDHIEHAVNLIGVDHVGIVSDFDGGGGLEGWNSAAETMNVTAELVARGYSEEDIGKIWSGNTLALWRRVDAVAAGL
ncbi:MAG: membrane dipeptidase [Kordiimonadaceae bacterium]|nr:membrane dipeptidase [Kordiimonadaceae bacterium]MBT6037084.1 membrane dipeptidase [Kordiimonadaceae bacterium]MBT6330960.1 membrane dipeptidase [Kordiimonadaceae bacterium]